jgi:hypothetical protein
MPIEEEVYYQPEFWGEQPQIPQWEAIADTVIVEEEERPRAFRKPKFQEDMEEGFI